MLSRVASSIYWMSRYLERADNVARFIDVNARLILDMGWEREEARWDPLVRATGDDAAFEKRYEKATEQNVVHFLTFDHENPNSILSCVRKARENARTTREVISSEMWQTMNALYHEVAKQSRKRRVDDLQAFLLELRQMNDLFAGTLSNTMSRGEAWHFAHMGKLFERADKTARMLDVKYFSLLPRPDYFDSPYDVVEWGAVLNSVSGFEMYRKKFNRPNYHDVAKFLILDREFPRSIYFCVRGAAQSLKSIVQILHVKVPVESELIKLESMVAEAQIDTILDRGLHEFVDVFQLNLNVVDDALYRSFFSHPS